MKNTFLNLIILLCLTPVTSFAGEELIKKYGDYEIYKSRICADEKSEWWDEIVTIYKNKQQVYKVKDHRIDIADYDADLNLLGNGKPILVLYAFSGGAHCCWDYHILELGKKFRFIQKIAELEDEAIIGKGKGEPYKFSVRDTTFNYFYGCYAETPKAQVTLGWNGKKFVFDTNSMKHKITKEEYIEIEKDLEQKLKEEGGTKRLYISGTVLKLIYSGNANLAFNIIDNFFSKENYYYEDNRIKPAQFKKNLLCQLKTSPYANAIKNMNNGYFEFPSDCVYPIGGG